MNPTCFSYRECEDCVGEKCFQELELISTSAEILASTATLHYIPHAYIGKNIKYKVVEL